MSYVSWEESCRNANLSKTIRKYYNKYVVWCVLTEKNEEVTYALKKDAEEFQRQEGGILQRKSFESDLDAWCYFSNHAGMIWW